VLHPRPPGELTASSWFQRGRFAAGGERRRKRGREGREK